VAAIGERRRGGAVCGAGTAAVRGLSGFHRRDGGLPVEQGARAIEERRRATRPRAGQLSAAAPPTPARQGRGWRHGKRRGAGLSEDSLLRLAVGCDGRGGLSGRAEGTKVGGTAAAPTANQMRVRGRAAERRRAPSAGAVQPVGDIWVRGARWRDAREPGAGAVRG